MYTAGNHIIIITGMRYNKLIHPFHERQRDGYERYVSSIVVEVSVVCA